MPAEPLGYLDYLKSAWRYKPRLGWLGRMPVNQMALVAFAMLGVVNPGFWFLGTALEVAYLAFLSTNSSFQKLVQGTRLLARQEGFDDKVQRVLASLSPESQGRYRRLLGVCGLILGISEQVAQDSLGTLRDFRAGGLNQLLWLFLRLLTSRELIVANLAQVDAVQLAEDLARLRSRLATAPPDSPLARSLQATIDIQTKRLSNLERARSSLDVIDAELERIEQQVRLIREESAVGGGPELLSTRLDAVTSTIGETSRWMDQHADFFGTLAVDDLDAAVTGLPRLPEGEPPPLPPPPPPRARQKG